MSTDLVYCPLCPQKAFKNQQGYHKHQKDIHTSKINNKNSKDELVNNCFRCYLCPNKTYKNQQRLSHHETIIHYNYNISPKHITQLPQEALDEFKNILIYTIQKQLKNNIKNVGLQSIKFLYLESQFVGIFGNYLTRYSQSRKWYQYIFKGENAVELIGQILGRTNWSVRSYLYGQQTNVILISSD
ncbi:2400_t:CDS:1, partial [Cetraspora pellucida]